MNIDGTDSYPVCELCGHGSVPHDAVTTTDGIWHCDDWTACGERLTEQMADEPVRLRHCEACDHSAPEDADEIALGVCSSGSAWVCVDRNACTTRYAKKQPVRYVARIKAVVGVD